MRTDLQILRLPEYPSVNACGIDCRQSARMVISNQKGLNHTMYAIKTDSLTKYYGPSRGITDISLTVSEGDFYRSERSRKKHDHPLAPRADRPYKRKRRTPRHGYPQAEE